MIKPFFKSLLILLFTSLSFLAEGQRPKTYIKNQGVPFIHTYTTADHGAHSQIYQSTQSEDGIMYFGGVSGIYQFDGQTWSVDRRIADDAFRDLTAGPDNRIYALTQSDFGYLYPDDQGVLAFRSLKKMSPEEFYKTGRVSRLDVMEDRVIFKSTDGLLLYDIEEDTIQMISPDLGFGYCRRVGDDFYVYEGERGLLQLEGNELVSVAGSELIKDIYVKRMMRYGENELLLLSHEHDLYRFDSKSLEPIEGEVADLLKELTIYSSEGIDGEYFAFGTSKAGIVIMDKAGSLVQKIDKSVGLFDGYVAGLFVDKDRNLWAAQHGAISHIILNSPITTLDERHGLDGYLNFMTEYEGTTWVSGVKGVFYKEAQTPWQKAGDHKIFQQFEEIDDTNWRFEKVGDDFFFIGNKGLLQLEGKSTKTVIPDIDFWASAILDEGRTLILGSTDGYLWFAQKEGGIWKNKGVIAGFRNPVDFLERADDGQVWLTDSGSGIYKLEFNAKRDSVINAKSYGPEDGLPEAMRNRVFRHSNGIIFATASGIYHYNAATDGFEPDEALNKAIGDSYVFRIVETGSGDYFVSLDSEGKAMLRKTANGYEKDFNEFSRIALHNSEFVFRQEDNLMVASRGIKHFDSDFSGKRSHDFRAHIRSVKVTNRGDSLVFGGIDTGNSVSLTATENALYLSFAANFYDGLNRLSFQSYLEGSEKGWSAWSDKPERNYTNLPHGTYTFKVRARNVYGDISKTDTYTFTILAPWYLTPWAYLLYLVLAVLVVYGIVKLYSRRLEREKIQLEQIVAQRTQLIREQKESAEKDKELIQQQADRLKELDKVKSRFFANISHELRTPLTLINTPLEALLASEKVDDEEILKVLETARKNGADLLSLVEEMLDVAKLDAGKLVLLENPVGLYRCVLDVFEAYTVGFQQKGINFDFDYHLSEELTVLLDERKFRKILNNLLSNALKFTPEKGEVSVSVNHNPDTNGMVLHVSDTGKGIHSDDLPFVFDRYYQSEQPDGKAEGGTGIGLALARELTELLGGKLFAVSELGKGSTFTLELPQREVAFDKVMVSDTLQEGALLEVLNQSLTNYSGKFNVDKPVLLITEDNPEMRAFVASTLKPYFDIREAGNGKEALVQLEKHHVDIVISDVMMPEMDGFELLRAIRSNKDLRQVSVIMLTARTDEEDKLEALTLGIDDYLTKPFSAAEFLARIKNILDNRIRITKELSELNTEVKTETNAHLGVWVETYGLSERELDVLKLLAKRFSSAEMADALCVSLNTIKFHRKNLYLKLGISSRAEVLSMLEEVS